MSEPPRFGVLHRTVRALGVVALVAVGIHAGADRLDDHAFDVFSAVAAVADRAIGAVVPKVLEAVGVSPETSERLTFQAIDAIDLDLKVSASGGIALFAELFVIFLLGFPFFFPVSRIGGLFELRAALRATRSSFTLLRIAAPLATAIASIAAGVTLATSLAERFASWADRLGIPDALLAGRSLAFVLATATVVLLGGRAVLGAIFRADRLAARDLLNAKPRLRRRLAGLYTLILAVPVAFLGLLGALFGSGG